jgi:putative ABC transport system ATP-binding protein
VENTTELGCCSTYPEEKREIFAELIGASKRFKSGNVDIVALHPTDVVLRKGELLLVVGPSGSGKTTLLSLLGCVLYPSDGCVCINGVNTSNLSQKELAQLRLREIGFIFQNYNLIAPLNVTENIMVPLLLKKFTKANLLERVKQAIDMVGLAERSRSLPKQLSGGEQQRVSIARALVGGPSVILCDEPTASLDVDSIGRVMGELRALADQGKSVAVVTHDMRLKQYADKMIYLENGRITQTVEE